MDVLPWLPSLDGGLSLLAFGAPWPVVSGFWGVALFTLLWVGSQTTRTIQQPFALAFWRWSVALLILLPLVGPSLWRERETLRRAGWRLWLAALLAISLYNCLLYSAAQTTAAINISLVSTCLPLATFIGAGLLLGQWPSRRAWLGLLLAMAGLLWLIGRGDWAVLGGLSFGNLQLARFVIEVADLLVLERRVELAIAEAGIGAGVDDA